MKEKSSNIVGMMYANDEFSKWLGIRIVSIKRGECVLALTVREEMLNGFGIAHGGITYSLADSALAFASNSNGKHSVSIETSISHVLPCKKGDEITATAKELTLSNKIAIYDVVIENNEGKCVALFKGTVYRKSTDWEV